MLKQTLMLMAAVIVCGCNPPATQTSAPEIALYAMDCGHAAFSDIDGFADDGSVKGQARDLVVPCYLIRHPSGDLIWDTGLPEAIADMPDGLAPPGYPARFTVPVKLSAQLAQLNLTPADIEYVSFSHMHSDHTGNGNLFAHSTWIVDADERTRMFDAEHRADPQDFNNYNQLEAAQTRPIEGDGDYDVFGDGSVVIVQAPGHTPGHTVLRVNLRNAGTVLLTGDMWHLRESRERRLVPRFNTDRAQTLASMDKVEALAAETNARVIRQHVQEDFDALPHFPQPLN
ncbi:N-acyl homoserine lactonase family protein [Terricaulis sp.]|uniref:N-acyl homoserine lactonase family protein n=1 Tax=Terricaulis sp. TaxID=2768686 RepID=UPI003783337E